MENRTVSIGAYSENVLQNYLPRSGPGLTWHGGVIPSSEIWIKLCGDKGNGSFKLALQLVNTAHPI